MVIAKLENKSKGMEKPLNFIVICLYSRWMIKEESILYFIVFSTLILK